MMPFILMIPQITFDTLIYISPDLYYQELINGIIWQFVELIRGTYNGR